MGVTSLPRELGAIWNRLPTGQKVVLATLAVGSIGLLVVFMSWSNAPDYVPLYSGLDPSDGAAVVDRLASQGIPYQVADGGGTVRVPSSQAAEARLDLAGMGLPSGGGVGFEIFDRQAFGVTDFVQQINLRRSLEGELTRTINQLDAVKGSRVHLAIPQDQLFTDVAEAATASVVIDQHPGRTLSAAQVRGIAHLVAQSVEGLEPDRTTILNTKGDILFDGETGPGAAGSTQLELTSAYEEELERELSTFLRSVLGPNKSAVEVTAELDFTATQTTSETFTPIEGGERSEQTVTETFTGSGSGTTGAVPGAVANIPGVDEVGAAAGETSASDYSRIESTTNSELNRTEQVVQTSPGEVQSLSISVLLDESIPEEQATNLQGAVAAAAGLDTERGDSISLVRIPFDTTELDEAEAAIADAEAAASQTNMILMAIPVVVVVLLGGIFFFFMRKVNKSRGQMPSYGLAVGGPAAAQVTAGAMAALAAGNAAEIEDGELQEVTRFATAQPKAVAEVVQTWMQDER